MTVDYQSYEIELKDDKTYAIGSLSGLPHYSFEYNAGKANRSRIYPINKRGIILREANGKLISGAILCENGGQSELNEGVFLIEGDKIWICVGDKLYGLELPALGIHCYLAPDYGTLFSINPFDGDMILFGDMGIVRIDKEGEIKWRFKGGNGVFIPGDGKLILQADRIKLTDGNGDTFFINKSGREIPEID